MPPVATPRGGRQVEIKSKPLAFSYWPMYKTSRRYGLQTNVYATNPLGLVRDAIRTQCPAAARPEALAYVSQAEFFLRSAAGSQEWAAKPLLLYYSFMNLAKAYILTRGVRGTLDHASHGLSEQLPPGGKEFIDAYLDAYPSRPQGRDSVFADFLNAISGLNLGQKTQYPLPCLMPQIVAGHRLWSHSVNQPERFVPVHKIMLMHDSGGKQLWLVFQIYSSNLTRHGFTHVQVLNESGLAGRFREVTPCVDNVTGETLLQSEQVASTPYTGRPSDEIPEMISVVRHSLWATVTSVAPHRQYYLYMVPTAEQKLVLPQLLGIYAVAYYLGSITRYRPQQFDSVLS